MARKRRHFPDTPLANYIESEINFMARRPGWNTDKIVKWPPNADDCIRIVRELEHDLSPENFCCDGELCGQDLEDKYVHFRAIIKELGTYAPAIQGLLNV